MNQGLGQGRVAKGFNLVMKLEEPKKLPELMGKLAEHAARVKIDHALGSLNYVHFARFLPLWDHGLLLIITEFDGEMADYVLDFAAVLDGEFSMILSYMTGKPRLPVSEHPTEFWEYVERNTRPSNPSYGEYPPPFTPYPDKTVLDITGGTGSTKLPPRLEHDKVVPDLSDVQANVLRGFRATQAVHFGLRFTDATRAQAFVSELATGSAIRVTAAEALTETQQGSTEECVNFGFTHDGLRALGISEAQLQKFPRAFKEGPAARAEKLGDVERSAPAHWIIGKPVKQPAFGIHAMVSLYIKGSADLTTMEVTLDEMLIRHGVATEFEFRAKALQNVNDLHFGYRDGIAQPSVYGVHTKAPKGQEFSPAGDFLLGTRLKNSRGGYYIGEIEPHLAENATYAAVRVIEQHVDVFEEFLTKTAKRLHLDKELVAAKLMGRWRDGSSLVRWPVTPASDEPAFKGKVLTDEALDAFDYVGFDPDTDDPNGLRCPMGAHIRRMNPRSGIVLGVPWGRHIIRRGLPYSRPVDGDDKAVESKGLFGVFFCGDLESQFEFLLRVWANGDSSAPGLKGTVDPFVGSRTEATKFHFHPTVTGAKEPVDVPPLTSTAGSLYLFMPGLKALEWIASQGATEVAANPGPVGKSGPVASPSSVAGPLPVADRADFSPIDPHSSGEPYKTYASLRSRHPVVRISAADDHVWVLSHSLVEEANTEVDVFVKPPGGGLFFMNPTRHTEVRAMLDADTAATFGTVQAHVRTEAETLLAAFPASGPLEWVGAFASKLPTLVFMEAIGIPLADRGNVNGWARALMKSHNPLSSPAEKDAGIEGGAQLHAYFANLIQTTRPATTPWGTPTLMTAMHAHVGCPVSHEAMSSEEVVMTAVNFALGGYLSTEFLLATGVFNLLSHQGQWKKLCKDLSLVPQAAWEMIRYDAPFQMADRVATVDINLGGVKIPARSKVTLVYGAANRDPIRDGLDDPTVDEFNINRKTSASNFGFGGGPHYCIGADLAMTVVQESIKALAEAFPNATIEKEGSWSTDPYFRTLDTLTLKLR